jgi:hypothetical protein
MHTYEYIISFGLKHPTSELKDAYEALAKIPGIFPGRLVTVGEQRSTPRGDILEGNYSESRCGFGFTKEWQRSDSEDLPVALERAIEMLSPHKDVLKSVVETGGVLDFFVGLGIAANSGFILEPALMNKLADMSIKLSFDLYPPRKEESGGQWDPA